MTIYLNHASTGPYPARTVRVLSEWAQSRAEPWRIPAEVQFGTLAESRAYAAALIGATPDEIALMPNTTYGLNAAAQLLDLKPGDVVVGHDREYPSGVYLWMAMARSRGIAYRQVPTVDGLASEDALIGALDEPGVRALCVSWVSFETGLKLDLARLGAACRERGITFIVDAMQGVGAAALDVHACHVDFLACGGQKWLLSPWGTGFLYVRRELVRQLEPTIVGWMAVKASEDFSRLCDYELNWFDDARRFEVITLPYQDFAGFNASLSWFAERGYERVYELVAERSAHIVAWAESQPGIRLVTPRDPARRAGIVSVVPRDPVSASKRLTEAGIQHSLREGAIRLAPHFYTTSLEIEQALVRLV